MSNKIEKLYGHCEERSDEATPGITLAEPTDELNSWQSRLDRTLDSLQSGKLKPEDLDPDLFNITLKDLSKGFQSSFNGGDITYTNPDYNFLTAINQNLYKFAGAKSYQELTDLNNMLTSEGKVVDFKTFRENIDSYRATALGIDEQYNSNWLYTEYTNAVNSGLAAKRWKEFEETADLFPNLEYRTAGDSNVRASHQSLNGVIKPINDPFWDTYYPPNDWGCRCRCRPTNENPASGHPERSRGDGEEIPELFRNNVGKTGAIFNESHPYFTSNGISKSKTFATVRRFETTDHYDAQLPKYKQLNAKYKTLSSINELGGSIHQEAAFIPTAEILGMARKLSLLGDSVVLLNPVEPQATALVQGIKSYFGSAKTASEIANVIAIGKDVAGVFTIDLATTVKSSAVKSALAGFKDNPRFKSAIFLKSGKKCVLTAKDLAAKNFEPLKSIGL